jgi:hypothetical protein
MGLIFYGFSSLPSRDGKEGFFMKTRQRLFFGFAVLALMAMFTLVSCGDNGDPSSPSSGNDSGTGTGTGGNGTGTDNGTDGNGTGTGNGNGTGTGGNGTGTGTGTGTGSGTGIGGSDTGTGNGTGTGTGTGTDGNGTGTGSGTTGTKPSTPTGVSATAQSSTSIRITWNAVSGATSYKIYSPEYADTNSGFVWLDTVTTTSYTDNFPKAGETWYYRVSAVNSIGESAQSSSVYAKTPGSSGGTGSGTGTGTGSGTGTGTGGTVSKPNPPYGIMILSGSTTKNSLRIEWDASLNATGYKLYRSTSSSGQFTVVYTGSSTTYTNTGLSAGTTYYYKVTATNSAGESDFNYQGEVSGTTKQ